MLSDFFKRITLKTKMSLAVTALFILFIIAASYLTFSYFERTLKESVSVQQSSLVSSLARSIDDKLRIAQNTLIVVAAAVPQDTWNNADKAQQFLDARIGVKSIFKNVVFLMSKEGKLIAESPYKPNRRGRDLSFRDYYKIAFATGKPYISSPFISTHRLGEPSICMTVPIFDKRGNMTGFLGGGIDLLGENFLADLATVKIGKTGYVYITDSNRIMIVHPDQNRIMKNAGLPGINKLHERALNGFEGSGETVNTSGIAMLSSFKRLSMTQWILAANYPISEAYAPMYKAERYFEISLVVAMVILLLITWLIMKRLMLPLEFITSHVKYLPEKPQQEHHIVIDSLDEIGILAAAFNTMIDTLDSQQELLHENAILLEEEIAERQMAQEALVVEQQELEKMNSMLYEFNNDLDERITQKVSELRQKDQILIRQNRQAAMGDMINNIAHQWRQPLNSIGLIVQSMMYSYEGGGLTEETMKADIDKTMETIKFMSQTIDDFRNYFKPDKEKTQFNVKMVINRSISIVAGSIGNVKITIESDEAVDPVIYGYPNEYSQVVLNILINARDALSELKISNPEIKIVIRMEKGKSVVTISDNAGGIPEDIIDKIFDPYFSTKGPDTGTGVGLFMSKNIIEENMSGRLTVCNSGEGAEFRIEI